MSSGAEEGLLEDYDDSHSNYSDMDSSASGNDNDIIRDSDFNTRTSRRDYTRLQGHNCERHRSSPNSDRGRSSHQVKKNKEVEVARRNKRKWTLYIMVFISFVSMVTVAMVLYLMYWTTTRENNLPIHRVIKSNTTKEAIEMVFAKLSDLDEKMSRHDESFSKHDDRLSQHDERLSQHDERLSQHDRKLDSVLQKLDQVLYILDSSTVKPRPNKGTRMRPNSAIMSLLLWLMVLCFLLETGS